MISENIKKLRQDKKLTQQEFAERIGLKRNTVATYEMGRSVPSDAAIELICREFGVNRKWLETGEGEMYIQRDSSLIEQLSAQYSLTPKSRELVENFLKLPPQVRELVAEAVMQAAKIYPREKESLGPAKPDNELTPEEMHALLDEEIDTREKNREKLLASISTNGALKKFGRVT